MNIDPVNAATIEILKRYAILLEDFKFLAEGEYGVSSEYLLRMCNIAIVNPFWHIDKMSRWLGFIQGIMVINGLINIVDERELTRPLFHNAYKAKDLDIPNSVTV